MINIVIPMAGRGTRVAELHRKMPKPLIEILPGKRMIEYVIDYLTLEESHRFIFICRKEHTKVFDLERFFRSKTRCHAIVNTDTVTNGPACSVLLAKAFIDNEDELLIAYCDDYLRLDVARYLAHIRRGEADGVILTYPSKDPMNSYVELDDRGNILRTAEKELIGPLATAGLYYFKQGRDYVRAARQMIRQNKSFRGEFFVCPVYNEMIGSGKTVLPYALRPSQYIGMGSPEELSRFKRRVGKRNK